ncbi:MAG: hypothetical protein KDI01_02680 [Halioglobus sp.]|nr:hypothetical protein [Halioglobus sp.]
MLSESSYLTGIYIWVGAGCAIALCLGWWLGRRWSPTWGVLAALLAAALLLTPAYPTPNAGTMAPALIVAAFQLLTAGYAGAEHALRPLGTTALVALLTWLSLHLVRSVWRRRSGAGPGASTGT